MSAHIRMLYIINLTACYLLINNKKSGGVETKKKARKQGVRNIITTNFLAHKKVTKTEMPFTFFSFFFFFSPLFLFPLPFIFIFRTNQVMSKRNTRHFKCGQKKKKKKKKGFSLNHNRMNQVNISIYDFKVNKILCDKKAIYQFPPP